MERLKRLFLLDAQLEKFQVASVIKQTVKRTTAFPPPLPCDLQNSRKKKNKNKHSPNLQNICLLRMAIRF